MFALIAQAQEIPKLDVFFQQGAMGILAMGFCAVLLLFWRADRRANRYARGLTDRDRHLDDLIVELTRAHVNECELIAIIKANTEVNGRVAAQLAAMIEHQKTHTEINQLLERRLALWQCPFRDGEPKSQREKHT